MKGIGWRGKEEIKVRILEEEESRKENVLQARGEKEFCRVIMQNVYDIVYYRGA